MTQRLEQMGLALLCLRIISVFPWMARLNLHPDEAGTWVASREWALIYFDRPPLAMVLMSISTAIFGSSEFVVRLPAWILSALSLFVLLRFFQSMADRTLGLWFLVCVLGSPLLLALQFVANIDSSLLFFWSLSIVLAWRSINGGTGWDWAFLGLITGLGMYAKYTMILAVSAPIVFLLWSPKDRQQFKQKGLYNFLLVFGLCLVPILVWNWQHGFVNLSYHWSLRHDWNISAERFVEYIRLQFLNGNPLLLGAALLAILSGWARREVRFLAAYALPLLFFGAVSLAARTPVQWPGPAHLAVAGLAALYCHEKCRLAGLRFLILLLIGVYLALFSIGMPWVVANLNQAVNSRWFSGWEVLAEDVAALRQELESQGQKWVIGSSNYRISAELGYYLRDWQQSYIINPDPAYQFFGPDHLPALGSNVLFIVAPQIQHQSVQLEGIFSSVEEGPPVQVTLRSEELVFQVLLARDFRGYPSHSEP